METKLHNPDVFGIVPIGSIISWDPGIPGCNTILPYGWFKCEGGIIPYGPMAGQTARNLNGTHRFLAGDFGSGALGGSSSHPHNLGTADNCILVEIGAEGRDDLAVCRHSHSIDYASHLPPYMNVIWIMRIA